MVPSNSSAFAVYHKAAMGMVAGQQNGGQQHSLDATTHAQLVDRRFWHDSDRAQYPLSGRFRGQTGKYVLILSLTAFDPSGHSEAFTRLAYRP